MPQPSRSVSRRSFLQTAGAATSAIALPTIVPRSVLAAPGRAGANDRVGVGYIAAGRRGGQLLDLPDDAQPVAVADIHPGRRDAFAKRINGTPYTDYRKLLEDKAVDAVVVSSPDHWHTLHSVHACQAGKDVYCEKPMTLTIREGRQLVNAVRKYKRVLQVGSQQRSMAANRIGCELIRNGVLGKIRRVVTYNYPSPWICALPAQPVPQGLDWDVWCGQTDVVPYHKDIFIQRARPGWISYRRWSGGEMTGWGSHGFDQVQWALGMDDSGPVEIWTEGAPYAPPTDTEPRDRKPGEALCIKPKVRMRYANGIVLELARGPHGGGIFIGENGRITIDRGKLKCDPPELAKVALPADAVRLEVSKNHLANWIDCIKSRKKPICDVEVGHRSATVCHLGNIARWLGRRAKWDPVSETFPGDDQANALIARTQRKPYEIPDV